MLDLQFSEEEAAIVERVEFYCDSHTETGPRARAAYGRLIEELGAEKISLIREYHQKLFFERLKVDPNDKYAWVFPDPPQGSKGQKWLLKWMYTQQNP